MTATKRHGTQSIERSMRVLRELASRGHFGWRLQDLAERCEIDRSTTHRILACLTRERMVQQRAGDRHYLPGPLVFELGLSMPAHAAFQAAAQPVLARLSRQFDGLAVLYLRSGSDWVCAAIVGKSPYRGMTTEVGTRRPLIASAGGVAILIALPKEEVQPIVAAGLKRMQQLGTGDLRALERMLRHSESLGYAFNQAETMRGVYSFGVPVRNTAGEVFASLTVGGTAEAFPPARIPDVVAALRESARRVEAHAARIFR